MFIISFTVCTEDVRAYFDIIYYHIKYCSISPLQFVAKSFYYLFKYLSLVTFNKLDNHKVNSFLHIHCLNLFQINYNEALSEAWLATMLGEELQINKCVLHLRPARQFPRKIRLF